MKTTFHLEARIISDLETLNKTREMCSVSGRTCWVTKTEKLRVHTIKGVPGKNLDLLLPDNPDLSRLLAIEIGLKTGCFDGAKRWRITFRSWNNMSADDKTPSLKFPPLGKFDIEEDGGDIRLIAR